MTDEPIPWAVMLRGALRFGLTPEAFWALSLKEWISLSQTAEPGGDLGARGVAALRAKLREFEKGNQSDGR